ncbi:hypothetical protein PQX77_013483 [Marasmius sp. AFHP31]|nr:hypothetical protein PQX77_013483 [Marasmius sp. AFHP31]
MLEFLLATNQSFTPSLRHLDIRADYLDGFDWDERGGSYYSDGIRKVLRRCAKELERLYIWTDGVLPAPGNVLSLPSLIEYVGPHDFLYGLSMTNTVRTIWVPAPLESPSSLTQRLSDCFGGTMSGLSLKHLSVLQWHASDVTIEGLFTLFPRLEDLSIQLVSQISKADLLALKAPIGRLRCLRGISIVAVTGHILSLDYMEAIAETWRSVCRTICYVRLDPRTKLVWKDGPDVWEYVEQGYDVHNLLFF